MNISINNIVVGERRREEQGDIAALAASIKRYGLIHPIVVDEHHGLIAGGRRLSACKTLGWENVEVRYFVTLTEAEKREIELEENVRRKDLTPPELSKQYVALAKIAAEIEQLSAPVEVNVPRGRPVEPGSDERVAERLGISPNTIRNARAHVAAVEKYPELSNVSQREALKTARVLDNIIPNETEAAKLDAQARESVAIITRIRQFSEAFSKWCQFTAKVQGEASAEELFEGFEAKQAAWFIQQSDEIIETLQSWRTELFRKHPHLKNRGLRRVN